MCEPVTLSTAAWLAIASTATAVVGGAVAYDASKKAESYQNQVAKQNMKVAEAQAVDAARLGQLEESERRLQARMQIASQTVGFAAQNVEQTGTALDILGDTAMFGEIDMQRIRYGAERKAWGYRMQGYDIDAQNRLQKFQAKTDRTGIILSTASKALSAWGSMGAAKPGASSASFTGGSGLAYQVPTTTTGAGWHNAYGGSW